MRRSNVATTIGIMATVCAAVGMLLWTHQVARARSESRRFQAAGREQVQSQSIEMIHASGAAIDQDLQRGGGSARTGDQPPVRTIAMSLASPSLPSRVMPAPNSEKKVLQQDVPQELRPPPRAPSKTLPDAALDGAAR
jgi:hypothetical protein